MIHEDYLINEKTLALEPAQTIDCDTIVIERRNTVYVRKTPLQLIKKACIYNWTTYDGCREAVMKNTNYKKKLPILINKEKNICTFPTHAIKHIDCKWIFWNHILKIIKDQETNGSIIQFYDGTHLSVPVSYYILQKQYERASECMLKELYKKERMLCTEEP